MVDSLVLSDSDFGIEHPRLSGAQVGQIEAAAQVFASDADIAAYVSITEAQLNEFYRDIVERGRASGRIWIRQQLFALAKGEDVQGDREILKALARTYLPEE